MVPPQTYFTPRYCLAVLTRAAALLLGWALEAGVLDIGVLGAEVLGAGALALGALGAGVLALGVLTVEVLALEGAVVVAVLLGMLRETEVVAVVLVLTLVVV